MSSGYRRVDHVARLFAQVIGDDDPIVAFGNLVAEFETEFDIQWMPDLSRVDIHRKEEYTTADYSITPADLLLEYARYITRCGDPRRADDYLEAAHRWREEGDVGIVG